MGKISDVMAENTGFGFVGPFRTGTVSAVTFAVVGSTPVSAELCESGRVFVSACDGGCDKVLVFGSSWDVSVDDTPLEVVG